VHDSNTENRIRASPALLGLASPVFVIYLLGSFWFILVAVGVIDETTTDGQSVAPLAGILAALACAAISLAGWAILKVKPWSRPLLLWLPVLLAVITGAMEYQIYGTIAGTMLVYLPSCMLCVLFLYWYLYRKRNVVEYFEQGGERGAA